MRPHCHSSASLALIFAYTFNLFKTSEQIFSIGRLICQSIRSLDCSHAASSQSHSLYYPNIVTTAIVNVKRRHTYSGLSLKMAPAASIQPRHSIRSFPPIAIALYTAITPGNGRQPAKKPSASYTANPTSGYISPYLSTNLANMSSSATPNSMIPDISSSNTSESESPWPTPSTATTDDLPSAPDTALRSPTSNAADEQWYVYYAKQLNRFWKRIRREAIDLEILHPNCRKVVKPEMISSTNVADPVTALCHYLVSSLETSPTLLKTSTSSPKSPPSSTERHIPSAFLLDKTKNKNFPNVPPKKVESHEYIHNHYSDLLPPQHPAAESAYPELNLLDRSAAEAEPPVETLIVLRYWFRDPGHGCIMPPVPKDWKELRGVCVVGVPDAVEFKEMEEEQVMWEGEEERQARKAAKREEEEKSHQSC